MDLLNKHQEQDGYGLSCNLWKGFPVQQIFGLKDRSAGWGFFDDFLSFSDTTLEDGYIKVQTSSGTVTQIASTGNTATTGIGICRLLTAAGDNSEAVIGAGNGLDAAYKLTGTDVCFECRVMLSDITTSSHGQFIGLALPSATTTVQCITAADAIYASGDFLGFQRLKDETSSVDGMYQVSGKTKVDGAVNTGLNAIATLVAGTYIKLGFRFKAAGGGSVHWFVNGAEISAAKLSVTACDASEAASFPDGSFMTPVACNMNDGTTASNLNIDWWACAQMA
jgi:hypothetical protein